MSKKYNHPREKFIEEFGEASDRRIELEKLYELRRANDIAERTRKNTSSLVTWIIAIPLIFTLIWLMLIFFGALAKY